MTAQEMYIAQIEQELKQTPIEYLPVLLNIIHAFREGVCQNSAVEDFKAGWEDIQNGRYHPISTLWDDIEK